MRAQDDTIRALAKAKNDLETFIVDLRMNLETDAYKTCSTDDEHTTIETSLGKHSTWYDDDSNDATPQEVCLLTFLED